MIVVVIVVGSWMVVILISQSSGQRVEVVRNESGADGGHLG